MSAEEYWIMKILKEKNMTQAEVARISGLRPSLVSQICTGQTKDPRISTVAKIAEALEIPVDEMIERYEYAYIEEEIRSGRRQFKNELERYFYENRINKSDFCKANNIDRSLFYRVVYSKNPIEMSFETCKAIANGLGMTSDELYELLTSESEGKDA